MSASKNWRESNMIWQLRIGNWKFTFTFAQVTDVIGVNSILPDGNHILMWDFDDVPLSFIAQVLRVKQEDYALPKIYILNTGLPNHHIAYCFTRMPWRHAFGIVASTPYVDWNFIKYAAVRGHFTLRVSPKNGRKPKLVLTLDSVIPETADIKELRSWVKYETLANGRHNKKWLLQISKTGCAVQTSQ
jgi:hypothetical protein